MIKIFTQDDVIRYVYNETSIKENEEIEKALICDAELQERYKEVLAMKRQLDQGLKQPSDKVINAVLNYSKSLNLRSNT